MCSHLGIDDSYFISESLEAIAGHITLLYSAKMGAAVRNEAVLDINLKQEFDDHGLYITTSFPGKSNVRQQVERRIDELYLDPDVTNTSPFRVECYLSSGPASRNTDTHIRFYFVKKCNFLEDSSSNEKCRDIRKALDQSALQNMGEEDIQSYQLILDEVFRKEGPVIELIPSSLDTQKLIVAFKTGSTEKFFASLTDLYHSYGFYATRKYVETLSNGVTFIISYLLPLPNKLTMTPKEAISQILKEISMLYTIPCSPLHEYFRDGVLNGQETVYGTAAIVFAQHFLNRLGKEYWSIQEVLDRSDPRHQQVLNKLKGRLRGETFTSEYIIDIVKRYPELIKILYVNFAVKHYVKPKRSSIFSATFISLQNDKLMDAEEILSKIRAATSNEHETMVFESMLEFNSNCTKTNFYNPNKVALSFKLDPGMLPKEEYPLRPFAMFLVIGSEFRGFHIRFQDISRGGVRIIRSANKEFYNLNKRSLFDENYALASTQNRKNKDIPEGGSKGTILLDDDKQGSARVAFEKYIDALLDILLDQPKRIKGKINAKAEILFFGPDEGTADFMDWASLHAKKRGLPYWKAITTGKSQALGGIPHDIYGMTTRSVHRYIAGIYKKFGLDEAMITKFQTGGPDGDLGSNEILVSNDKTIAIVDGSGVLCDPNGLNRDELIRLAKHRKMVNNFDTGKLSRDGFRVLVEENDAMLPDGRAAGNGLEFRNTFHLNPLSSADIFVPCGGRPEAVDIGNYTRLLFEDGSPRFKYIVEGANLFFTQEARVLLEEAGCFIIKDASANKGGVTSSSLEVLAALSMTDEQFQSNMTIRDGIVPQFYNDYVDAAHQIIERNADLEFECIWNEKEKNPEKSRTQISDELSLAIISLKAHLQEDNALWKSTVLRKLVLSQIFPKILIDKVGGLDKLIENLPENYLRAAFSSFMASRFVYKFGPKPRQLAFFSFMNEFIGEIREIQE